MRTRFTWVLGILVLISIGSLIACGTKYSPSNNGLVVVSSQGRAVMQTFSLNLNNGGIAQINNAAGPPTPGLPSAVVLDPAGAFAYVIVTANSGIPGSTTGIASFPIGSDGKLAAGSTTALSDAAVTINGENEKVPVVPVALAIDSAGKFLFVANSVTTDISGNAVAGSVSVFAVSNGTLTEVTTPQGTPFSVPASSLGPANLTALAVSPTVFPVQFAACSQGTAPTSENLYVTDSVSDMVWEFGVSSSGALVAPPGDQSTLGFATGTVPSGIAVDACNRFVYVANGSPGNSVRAYTICNAVLLPTCVAADGSLIPVAGDFATQGIGPGPMAEDPYGNYLYVVNTLTNSVSGFKISPVTGALTAINPAPIATNLSPVSIAIRSDDTWLFVANFGSANVSQYSITPASGQLTAAPQAAFATENNPYGVAVK